MNKDELTGGARYLGGKAEKAVGDAIDSGDWKVTGVVDQVLGGAQHGYGRVRSIAEEALESAPDLADEARNRLKAIGKRVAAEARASGRAAVRSVEDSPALWALAAGLGAYALAWLIHRRRD